MSLTDDEQGGAYGLDALYLIRRALEGDSAAVVDDAARLVFGYKHQTDAVALAAALAIQAAVVLRLCQDRTGVPVEQLMNDLNAAYLIPGLDGGSS